METLLLNLSGNVRRETLDGRNYLVAPMVMLNPGVLNGSRGPLYYPMEEVVSNVDAWNGMPIVINHPTLNGKPVSARSPEVLEKFGVGYVFKATGENKLAAEAWIDIDKAELVDNRIVDSLNAGLKLELSTGLYVDQEAAEEGATFNSQPYSHVARNLRPDHLAILPDTVGACSLNDGCGVLVNKECKCQTTNSKEDFSMAKQKLVDELVANCSCWEDADRETLNSLSEDKLQSLIEAGKPAEPKAEEVTNQVETTFEDEDGNVHTWNEEAGTWETKKPEPKEEPKEEAVTNQEPAKPQTEAEWLESAPEGIRRAVQNAISIEAKQRAEIIESIVANLEGDAKDNLVSELDKMPLDALEKFGVLANKKQEPKKSGSLASYFGQAGAPAPSQEPKDVTVNQELLLDVPRINYKELSKSL